MKVRETYREITVQAESVHHHKHINVEASLSQVVILYAYTLCVIIVVMIGRPTRVAPNLFVTPPGVACKCLN